jgi:hypothetical protein
MPLVNYPSSSPNVEAGVQVGSPYRGTGAGTISNS